MSTPELVPRSLVWATDIQVLPRSRVLERHEGYLVVRSPENPTHYWGNFLLFDEAPTAGAAGRWEQLFEAEFSASPAVTHRAFGWDRPDGDPGEARGEFVSRGYELEEIVGLSAPAGATRPHPRENREVTVAALDPQAGAEADLWEQVVDVWMASSEAEPGQEQARRAFVNRRLDGLRSLFCAGMGSWYVALDGGEVVGCCGIVASGPLGRFQSVDTRTDWRSRGVCSRLLVEACRHSERRYGVERFVIAADVDYHARGLYESLGFEAVERVACVCLAPNASAAVSADVQLPQAGRNTAPD